MNLVDYNNNLFQANHDLSNVDLTEQFIEDFFVSTNPKYEAAIDVSLPYTATDYGYVHPWTFVYTNDVYIYVNGILFGRWNKISKSSSQLRDTCSYIKVKPGDVVTSNSAYSAAVVRFYPLEEPV